MSSQLHYQEHTLQLFQLSHQTSITYRSGRKSKVHLETFDDDNKGEKEESMNVLNVWTKRRMK